ncbi:MAG: CPBP family intramembrane metalloprotease [Eubacteriales bacterium]|nr:CPBP family intramembrane metalloprotease [Eubacteriales bacterium]
MKKALKKLSPWNNSEDMPTAVYVIKKLLAFLMIYWIAAIMGESMIIGLLYVMGYDPLHGVMPTGKTGVLLPYYGFMIFLLVTIVYYIFIEKRDLKSLGYSQRVTDYFLGGAIAVFLLGIIISLCCITNAMSWVGVKEDIDIIYFLGLWIGFMIQSAAEETMCRGFLLQALRKRTATPIAIFVSTTAFALPHFPTLWEGEIKYAVIGIINLYLISIIFSLLVLFRLNLWIACGLHSIWNFILYGVMGLSLSGSEINSDGIIKLETNAENIINGGIYGIESSIITTVILGIVSILFMKHWRDRRCRHGI